jgi:hypothetical protein
MVMSARSAQILAPDDQAGRPVITETGCLGGGAEICRKVIAPAKIKAAPKRPMSAENKYRASI